MSKENKTDMTSVEDWSLFPWKTLLPRTKVVLKSSFLFFFLVVIYTLINQNIYGITMYFGFVRFAVVSTQTSLFLQA